MISSQRGCRGKVSLEARRLGAAHNDCGEPARKGNTIPVAGEGGGRGGGGDLSVPGGEAASAWRESRLALRWQWRRQRKQGVSLEQQATCAGSSCTVTFCNRETGGSLL